MRALFLSILLAGALAAPASAGEIMVVGRDEVLSEPLTVNAFEQRVPVVGKSRCVAPGRTPLAALLDTELELTVKDFGSCGKRPADSSGLYVSGIGGDRAKPRGKDGWVFKVRNRQPSSGAADLASRTRSRILWFWCRMSKGGCQRNLEVRPAKQRAAAGSTLTVTVRAYDDDGRAIPARGAQVTVGPSDAATTNRDGVARVELGEATGRLNVVATQAGRVRSFDERVRVR